MGEVVDPARPAHWVTWRDDGAGYAYAPELAAPGFFEDVHAGEADAYERFTVI